ncbi:MAG: multidrug efflux SMR transporter [Holosporales bacterium]|jgi:quaternary ammonium compound-resistance protein SugE|nr:multidrug efflux SMR transporter [Holosporales bacterium]
MYIYWIYLILAGLLEIGWATFLKLSNGFTIPLYSAITIVGMMASFYFLALATKALPLGTSYAIWTGIRSARSNDYRSCLFQRTVNNVKNSLCNIAFA